LETFTHSSGVGVRGRLRAYYNILFCFPFSIALADIGSTGYWVGVAFLTILTVGFFYEWSKGALDWA
jgi:NADH:ubiquinone oxidoreductase subunit 3 (subunit A)